jgi:hypothetical protein
MDFVATSGGDGASTGAAEPFTAMDDTATGGGSMLAVSAGGFSGAFGVALATGSRTGAGATLCGSAGGSGFWTGDVTAAGGAALRL